METFLLLVAPVIGVALLILLPFYSGTGGKEFSTAADGGDRRIIRLLSLGLLAYLADPTHSGRHIWKRGAPRQPGGIREGPFALELQGGAFDSE